MRIAVAVAGVLLASAALASPKANPYLREKPAAAAKPVSPKPKLDLVAVQKTQAIISAAPRRRDNPYVVSKPRP
jgi:hypothetical protein